MNLESATYGENHWRLNNSPPDSGQVELGKSECKVNTNIRLFSIYDCGYGTLKVEFTLCINIITIPPQLPVLYERETFVAVNTQPDFQQFCNQTLNDFESMLSDATTADLAIKVVLGKEKVFLCHKFILTGKLQFLFILCRYLLKL